MSKIEIIKDAGPVPTPTGGKGSNLYPFADMAVGDAFDVPRSGKRWGATDAVQSAVGTAAIRWTKRHNPAVKFTVRILDERTVRCWRIA